LFLARSLCSLKTPSSLRKAKLLGYNLKAFTALLRGFAALRETGLLFLARSLCSLKTPSSLREAKLLGYNLKAFTALLCDFAALRETSLLFFVSRPFALLTQDAKLAK